MAIVTDRPNSTDSTGSGFTAVGAASMDAAVSDDSDASYVQTPTPSTSPTPVALMPRLGFPNTVVPVGATIDRVRVRIRVKDDSPSPVQTWVYVYTFSDGFYAPNPTGSANAWTTTEFPGLWMTVRPDGGPWTQAALDGMQAVVAAQSTSGPAQPARLIEIWRDIEYTPGPGGGDPTLTVTASVDVGELRPDFEWDISDPDSRPQETWRAKVFSSDQYTAGGFDPDTDTPAWDSGDVASVTDRDGTVGADLVDGVTYRVYMLVTLSDTPDEEVGWSESNGVTIFVPPEPPGPGPGGGGGSGGGSLKGRILGIGRHRVEVRTRGGGRTLGVLQHSRLSWTRQLDEVSSAEVTAAKGSDIDPLASLREWQHELLIYRDEDPEPVWLGPCTPPPTFGVEAATVSARDLFAWLERRVQPTDRAFTHADLADVFAAYVRDVLAVENSMGMTLSVTPSDVTGDRAVTAASLTRCADALRELARTGVDWTVIGRRLLVGGVEIPTPDIPTLVDEHFLNPVVTPLGGASKVYVRGGSADFSAVVPVGVAADVGSPLGLVETVADEPGILDQISADRAAATRLDLFGDDPKTLRATLDPSAPVDFTTLVPGAHAYVKLADHTSPIDGPMRLLSVTVTHEVGDSGETETVEVVFTPVGTVA